MIARRCSECNTKWYSADTRAWKCDKCGAEITDETRVDLMEKGEDINGDKNNTYRGERVYSTGSSYEDCSEYYSRAIY
jgi:PHP family Zn ribbon phosphoesterase